MQSAAKRRIRPCPVLMSSHELLCCLGAVGAVSQGRWCAEESSGSLAGESQEFADTARGLWGGRIYVAPNPFIHAARGGKPLLEWRR